MVRIQRHRDLTFLKKSSAVRPVSSPCSIQKQNDYNKTSALQLSYPQFNAFRASIFPICRPRANCSTSLCSWTCRLTASDSSVFVDCPFKMLQNYVAIANCCHKFTIVTARRE